MCVLLMYCQQYYIFYPFYYYYIIIIKHGCEKSTLILSINVKYSTTLSDNLKIVFYSYANYAYYHTNIFISGLQWVSSVSYLKWGFQGLVLAEIPKLTFECNIVNRTMPCIGNGTQAIQLYAMDNGSVLDSSLALLGSIFAYLLLYFICLKFIPQKPHQM